MVLVGRARLPTHDRKILADGVGVMCASAPGDPVAFLGEFLLKRSSGVSAQTSDSGCFVLERQWEVLKVALDAARQAIELKKPDAARQVKELSKKEELSEEEDNQMGDATWSTVAWVKSLKLETLISESLSVPLDEVVQGLSAPERSAAELAFFRSLGTQSAQSPRNRQLVMSLMGPDVLAKQADKFCHEAESLVDVPATVDELSAKFSQGGELFYGDLKTFNAGLDATLGPPNPNLYEAMQSEHVKRSDYKTPFTADNYRMETCSQTEWWFVADSEKGLKEIPELEQYPFEPELSVRKRRHAVPLHTYDVGLAEVNADLRPLAVPPMRREELIGARLYTGPLFYKYNCVLRGAGDDRPRWAKEKFKELCHANKYETTIWVINSVS